MPILDVPQIGQWGLYANAFTNDCGIASLMMCFEYCHLRGNLTVDALATESALRYNDNGLLPSQLVDLAWRHGLSTRTHNYTSLDDLRAEIDALRPVIVLVNYGYITGRLDQGFSGGHFFVVVGYDDTHFAVNDPDWWYPYEGKGHDILIPIRELDLAMNAYSGQCVFMEQQMTIPDQLIEIGKRQEADGKAVQTLAAQISATPPTIPGQTMYATDDLNVRRQPNTSQPPATSLKKGDAVQVEDSGTAGWKRIVYGPWTNCYLNATYLSLTRPQ